MKTGYLCSEKFGKIDFVKIANRERVSAGHALRGGESWGHVIVLASPSQPSPSCKDLGFIARGELKVSCQGYAAAAQGGLGGMVAHPCASVVRIALGLVVSMLFWLLAFKKKRGLTQ